MKPQSSLHMVLDGVFGQILAYSQLYLIIKNKSAWDVSFFGFVSGFLFAFSKRLITVSGISSIGAFLVVVAIFIYQ